MQKPLFAYYVLSDEHTSESIQQVLMTAQLDQCWLAIRELDLQLKGSAVLMIEMHDLASGTPLNVPDLGEQLSVEGRTALLVAAADPQHKSAAFEVYADGETRFSWAGQFDSFEAELDDGQRFEGSSGFGPGFTRLTGLDWLQLLEASGRTTNGVNTEDPEDGDEPEDADLLLADEHTDLLLRGRIIGLPVGMPRRPELFQFHYSYGVVLDSDMDEEAVLEDLEEEEPELPHGDQLALVLIDPSLVDMMWNQVPAANASKFFRALEPVQVAVLGPLAGALPRALEFSTAQLPDRPLADAPQPERIAYELLAMASAVGYLSGDTVDFYDQLFFPLLGLSDTPIAAEVVSDSLDEIADRGLLSAMVEVLPYSVPEGEMLESFADNELTPLAPWAAKDGEYEGSLFLLDIQRLAGVVDRFDPDAFSARIAAFLNIWLDLAGPEIRSDPRRVQLDEQEMIRFQWRLEELELLLALGRANRLQPALFFYGD